MKVQRRHFLLPVQGPGWGTGHAKVKPGCSCWSITKVTHFPDSTAEKTSGSFLSFLSGSGSPLGMEDIWHQKRNMSGRTVSRSFHLHLEKKWVEPPPPQKKEPWALTISELWALFYSQRELGWLPYLHCACFFHFELAIMIPPCWGCLREISKSSSTKCLFRSSALSKNYVRRHICVLVFVVLP